MYEAAVPGSALRVSGIRKRTRLVLQHTCPILTLHASYCPLDVTHQELQQQDCHVNETHTQEPIVFIFLFVLYWVSAEKSLHDINISLFVKTDQNELLFRALSDPRR